MTKHYYLPTATKQKKGEPMGELGEFKIAIAILLAFVLLTFSYISIMALKGKREEPKERKK